MEGNRGPTARCAAAGYSLTNDGARAAAASRGYSARGAERAAKGDVKADRTFTGRGASQ